MYLELSVYPGFMLLGMNKKGCKGGKSKQTYPEIWKLHHKHEKIKSNFLGTENIYNFNKIWI